jgi:hypothetical protein
MKQRLRGFTPVILLFIILNGFFLGGRNMLLRWGINQDVVIIGNLILFCITAFSFFVGLKGLNNPNPHAFVRSVYTGMMIKLFACVFAAFIYISANRDSISKPALFTCMGLYLVYTFLEVSLLTKLMKKKPNE